MKHKLYLHEFKSSILYFTISEYHSGIDLTIEKVKFFYSNETDIDFEIKVDVEKEDHGFYNGEISRIKSRWALVKPYLSFKDEKDMIEFGLKWL